ncbi:MAG: hypothetical protein CMO44_12140 [Verrucomicrobiales bacterium]|nr:hypothetical protein [Verrucomicrobiales bacterium]|tara:strand:+ start:938 stop:2167 length:1230 start_codon:yes stop_codon:yes gene_type:complete
MKPGDFARKAVGGAYLSRTNTLFDKALNLNGRVNRFVTQDGIVEVGGFEIIQSVPAGGKNKKKLVRKYYDFSNMKGDAKMIETAKHHFNSMCMAGFRGKNNIEFTCNHDSNPNWDAYLDLSDFEKTAEFDGQGSNSESKNLGLQYEEDLFDAFMQRQNGEPVTKYKDHVDLIVKKIENEYKSPIIDIKHDGTKDTGRPLKRDGQGPYISNGGAFNLNIGAKISDITLTLKNRNKIYLSVKFGNTLSFFNVGVKKEIFPESDMKTHTLKDFGREYLDMFDIDHNDFLNIFEKYKKENTSAVVSNHLRTVTLSGSKKAALVRLIKSGVGHGYWMTHYDGGTLHFYEVNEQYMNRAANLKGNTVNLQYGGAGGTAKRINMNFETTEYDFSFNIRNTQGGIYPSRTNGDYFKK